MDPVSPDSITLVPGNYRMEIRLSALMSDGNYGILSLYPKDVIVTNDAEGIRLLAVNDAVRSTLQTLYPAPDYDVEANAEEL